MENYLTAIEVSETEWNHAVELAIKNELPAEHPGWRYSFPSAVFPLYKLISSLSVQFPEFKVPDGFKYYKYHASQKAKVFPTQAKDFHDNVAVSLARNVKTAALSDDFITHPDVSGNTRVFQELFVSQSFLSLMHLNALVQDLFGTKFTGESFCDIAIKRLSRASTIVVFNSSELLHPVN